MIQQMPGKFEGQYGLIIQLYAYTIYTIITDAVKGINAIPIKVDRPLI